jgi:aspartate/methionine/tyrosine aminotransferase
MGPRYIALRDARDAMRSVCDRLEIPLSIGGSFYGTAALVDAQGRSLLKDDRGAALTDAKAVISALVARYGLVGAPGGMFSPAPEATLLVRLTAAVTLADVERVGVILEQLLEQARA